MEREFTTSCSQFGTRVGALRVLFSFAVAYRIIGHALGFAGTVAVLALTVMLSMKLIGFLMLAVRHEALAKS